jgi:hypothetical protein
MTASRNAFAYRYRSDRHRDGTRPLAATAAGHRQPGRDRRRPLAVATVRVPSHRRRRPAGPARGRCGCAQPTPRSFPCRRSALASAVLTRGSPGQPACCGYREQAHPKWCDTAVTARAADAAMCAIPQGTWSHLPESQQTVLRTVSCAAAYHRLVETQCDEATRQGPQIGHRASLVEQQPTSLDPARR